MSNKQSDTSIFQNLKRLDPSFDRERSYDISALFNSYSPHLNECALYFTYYRRMPSLFTEIHIDCASAVKAVINKYRDGEKNVDRITDWYISKVYVRNIREIDDVFLFLKDDILLYFDTQHGQVKILFKRTSIQEIELLAEEIRKFKKKSSSQPQISILFQEDNKLAVKSIDIKKSSLRFTENYNDDFPAVHTIIRKRLSKKKSKGLVLLHGKPGTGKTSLYPVFNGYY